MTFRGSEGTVGVEYELTLVSADTLELADGALTILDHLGEPPWLKPELIQSTVEVITPVCETIDDVDAALRRSLSELLDACAALGLEACGAGTHPFSRRLATITPLPRYERLAGAAGLLGPMQVTQALQVHVGVASASDAARAMAELRPFLPVLLALSASSPFWYGHDTGFASWRQRILAADRTYGLPPRFTEWAEIEAFFEEVRRAGLIATWRDLHWDIRPRPDYGTVEVRVMDTVPTVTDATALAAFARALVHYLLRTPMTRRAAALPRPLRGWMERENQFQASRLGLDAPLRESGDAIPRRLGDVVDATLEAVSRVAEELGDAQHLAALVPRRLDPSYARQRRVRREAGSCAAVVAALAQDLRRDVMERGERALGSVRPHGPERATP